MRRNRSSVLGFVWLPIISFVKRATLKGNFYAFRATGIRRTFPDRRRAYAAAGLLGALVLLAAVHAGASEPVSLLWVKKVPAAVAAKPGNPVAAFSDGSSLVTGILLKGATVFGVGEANQTTLTFSGPISTFVARYNSDGTLAWVKGAGGNLFTEGFGVTAFSDGSAIVTGYFTGTTVFSSGEADATTFVTSHHDLFVARYNANGTLAWARRATAVGNSSEDGRSVAAFSDGSSVITGPFSGSAVFGAGEANATTLVSAAFSDIFVARYNANGTLAWARRAGGGGAFDEGMGVAAFPDGSSIVTGSFGHNTGSFSAVFGPGEANATTLANAGGVEMFVARYNANGTLAWARRAGSTAWDQGRGVAAFSDGSSIVTGDFNGSVAFGSGEPNATTLVSAGGSDIFAARYNANGTLAWARRAGSATLEPGDPFAEQGLGVAVFSSGASVVTGRFTGSAVFGAGEPNATTLVCAGQYDIFIARYNADGTLVRAQRTGAGFRDRGIGVSASSDGSIVVTGECDASSSDGVVFGAGEPNQTVLFFPTGRYLARYAAVNSPPLAKAGPDECVLDRDLDDTLTTVTLNGTASSDPDGTALTYSWIQTSGPAVSLMNANTASPSFIAPSLADHPDGPPPPLPLTFQLTVTDGQLTSTDEVTITVKHENLPPTASATAPTLVNEGELVTLDGSASTDGDGDPLTYHWVQTGGALVTLSDNDSDTAVMPSFTLIVDGSRCAVSGESLTFHLVVGDGIDSSTSADVSVFVKNLNNHFPFANAGEDQTVCEASPVQLAGVVADSDGDTLTVTWNQIGGTAVTLSDIHSASPAFTAPATRAGETLTFQLVVSDECSPGDATALGAIDEVNIVIKHVNQAPVADAGLDQCGSTAVKEGSMVTLSSSPGSFDPDSDSFNCRWEQISGPAVLLSDPNSCNPTFTAPPVGPAGETLTFELTVTDAPADSFCGGSVSATDRVTVCIENVNHCPIAVANVDAGQGPFREVTVVEGGSVSLISESTDPDNDSLNCLWSSTPPGVNFGDNSTCATIAMIPMGKGGQDVVINLTVDDHAGCTAADRVTVHVKSANAPPDCSLARANPAVLWPPNHKLVPVQIVGVTDPDNNSVVITITGVTQDEPLNGLGDGDTCPDAVLAGDTVLLRAERASSSKAPGNGRVYQVTFTADDGRGGICTGSVRVCVPQDMRNGGVCVDDGSLKNSTGPCP